MRTPPLVFNYSLGCGPSESGAGDSFTVADPHVNGMPLLPEHPDECVADGWLEREIVLIERYVHQCVKHATGPLMAANAALAEANASLRERIAELEAEKQHSAMLLTERLEDAARLHSDCQKLRQIIKKFGGVVVYDSGLDGFDAEQGCIDKIGQPR